jgi:hypothetical protein
VATTARTVQRTSHMHFNTFTNSSVSVTTTARTVQRTSHMHFNTFTNSSVSVATAVRYCSDILCSPDRAAFFTRVHISAGRPSKYSRTPTQRHPHRPRKSPNRNPSSRGMSIKCHRSRRTDSGAIPGVDCSYICPFKHETIREPYHAVSLPCRVTLIHITMPCTVTLIPTYHAVSLPCRVTLIHTYHAVSFVKVRV